MDKCIFRLPNRKPRGKVSVRMRVVTIQENKIVSDTAWERPDAMTTTRASSTCALGAPQRSNEVGQAGMRLRHGLAEGC
jgi:hypothetical protein